MQDNTLSPGGQLNTTAELELSFTLNHVSAAFCILLSEHLAVLGHCSQRKRKPVTSADLSATE